MSDSGVFRSAIGGFHKQDVLRYIDELQAEHLREREELEAQLAEVQTELAEAQEAHRTLMETAAAEAEATQQQKAEWEADSAQLQRLVDEQNSANRMLRTQIQDVREDLSRLQTETAPLRKQLEATKWEAASMQARLDEAAAHEAVYQQQLSAIADLKKQLGEAVKAQQQAEKQRLEAEAVSQRYAELIGDIGSFIMEVRSMGRHVLSSAHTRGNEALTAVNAAVALLQQQLSETTVRLEAAGEELSRDNQGAEQRLEELAQSLSRSADAIEAETEPSVRPNGPAPSDFFR